MGQCKCSQSRSCNCCNTRCSHNSNSIGHVSIITSPVNTNNTNNCCCCCCCCCNCGQQPANCSNPSFCFLKSYLEEVLGWENVVKPCSNYGSPFDNAPGLLNALTKSKDGKDGKNLLSMLAGILGNENLDKLKNFPQISNDFNMEELISKAFNGDFSDLEETVFE